MRFPHRLFRQSVPQGLAFGLRGVAANNMEALTAPAFQNTPHYRAIKAAERYAVTDRQKYDLAQATAYYAGHWPAWNDRTRSSASSTALLVLGLLTRGMTNDKLCADAPTFSPEWLEHGYVWIDDFPPLAHRELGVMIQTVNRLAVQTMVSRRKVTPENPPKFQPSFAPNNIFRNAGVRRGNRARF